MVIKFSILFNMENNIRKAEFSGRFYPGSAIEIERLLNKIAGIEAEKIDFSLSYKTLLGAIVPHAGYVYSAYEAIHVYLLLKKSAEQFETFIIINPNHTGRGNNDFNLSGASFWETPLGKVPVDREFSEALQIEVNDQAHLLEHSGEVQLPFLQYFLPYRFKIVMITMNHQSDRHAQKLAESIKRATQTTKRKIFILASSDFSHYESPNDGFRKDQLLIDQILTFNASGMYQQVKQHQVSACGYGPIMSLIYYAKLVDPNSGIRLLRRGNSGEVYPSDKVVDYVSFLTYL